MNIKKTVKKFGRLFIDLKQENEEIIAQSLLIVDNGYSWLGHLVSAIRMARNYFPKAKLSVITSPERKAVLQKDFPSLDYVFPSEEIRIRKYRIALQMLRMRKEKYDLILLFSLDVTPLVASLTFFKSRVILYNQWSQWWSLRLRNINEIFRTTYVKKKTKFSLKNLLKDAGLFFVLLERKDEEALGQSVLIIDNGYALFKQLYCAVEETKEYLPQAKISVLTLEQRKELKEKFPGLEIIEAGDCVIRKYRIARQMIGLRRNSYNYIILLSLDITPIIASFLFMKGRALLYNRWHQWWSLKPRSARDYLMVIPRFILNIIIFAYLLISVLWIFLKRSLNVFRFSFFKMRR